MSTEPKFFETNPVAYAVGKPLDRLDGPAKVTGQAKYAAEYALPGLVHAVLHTSSIAKGRIRQLDASAARRLPGVLAVLTHENIPPLAVPPSRTSQQEGIGVGVLMSFMPLSGNEIFYAAQPIAVVVADTLEHAQAGSAAIQVDYELEKPLASFRDAGATLFSPPLLQDGLTKTHTVRGNPQAAFAAAPIQLTHTYDHAINHHNPMEPGAITAHWEAPDQLRVYESTQAISHAQKAIATMLGLAQEQVHVSSQFIGGGFGSKGSTWPHTMLAVRAAKVVGRPVRLALTRPQMYTSMGHREDQTQTLKIGATADGRLVALLHEKTSTTSPWDDYAEANAAVTAMQYACPNYESRYQMARANVLTSIFMRAPGHAPGSFAMECSLDDLAHQLGLDPMEIRRRNYAETDPSNGKPWSSNGLKQCYARGAELFGWAKRNPKPGATREGNLLVGWGMATASHPVYNSQGSARARLYSDGHAVVQSGATDLGTGTLTVMTQVAADGLGLPVENVRFELGDSRLPTAPFSAASVAAGTVSSAVYLAVQDIWQQLIKLASEDARSPLHGAAPAAVEVVQGRMQLKAHPAAGETSADLMHRLGMSDVEGMGQARSGGGHESPMAAISTGYRDSGTVGVHSMQAFGVHFCEVKVHAELGTVHVTRWVTVHAAGRILNAKTARSQGIGGVVYGIGSALMEQTTRDAATARYTNATLADYHIPVNADIPDITVEYIDEHDPYINAMGVKGIGEIASVGAAAAVANAVFHATGKRIRSLPMTPDKLLAAKPVA